MVNALGAPVDGLGTLEDPSNQSRSLESRAPSIMDRRSVHEPFATGVTAVDAMIPIGRGQRELIIGDRQTGKTTVAVDAILNQTDVVCVYVAVGQKTSTVAEMLAGLTKSKDMSCVIVVLSGADEASTLQFLAPYTGATIAEYFMYLGTATCAIYDDLTKQAVAYREMCLLLRRPPAREAYPGDVFYLHARLLYRGAKLNDALGGGSMTALPVEVAGQLKLQLAQFTELQAFSQFASDLDASTQKLLLRGSQLRELLKQSPGQPYSVLQQVALIYTGTRTDYLEDIPLNSVQAAKLKLVEHFGQVSSLATGSLGSLNDIEDELKDQCKDVVAACSNKDLGSWVVGHDDLSGQVNILGEIYLIRERTLDSSLQSWGLMAYHAILAFLSAPPKIVGGPSQFCH